MSTDAGCASDLFSEASAAAVTCAIMKPELTPPSWTRNGGSPERFVSIRSAIRALGKRTDFGDREREIVRREGHRLGMEVAAGENLRVSANTSGLSETAFASVSRMLAAWRSWSRHAPITCGWQRRLYGSCTRGQFLCDSRMALPARRAR